MSTARTQCTGNNGYNMKTPFALRVARALLIASAITSPIVSAAVDNGGKPMTGNLGDSPVQEQSTYSWFNADALDINVYGLAYHPDRETVHRRNLDNEFNPGLGLHYEIRDDIRGTTFAELGAYEDSGRSVAVFAALGYQFKLGERWRVGGALAFMNSETYNKGANFVGMVPVVTYDMGRVKLNATYFPKFGNYNKVAAFGLYLGIPLGKHPG
jgi:hypothetical protein